MLGLIGGDKTYENDGVQRQRKILKKLYSILESIGKENGLYIFY